MLNKLKALLGQNKAQKMERELGRGITEAEQLLAGLQEQMSILTETIGSMKQRGDARFRQELQKAEDQLPVWRGEIERVAAELQTMRSKLPETRHI